MIGVGLAALIGLVVFALGFIVAPHACEGGLDVYFWCGVAALAALLALPFVAANVRIICRLF